MPGSLAIVGIGIQVGAHLTLSGQAWIQSAERVLFAVTDPVMAEWIQKLNPAAKPLMTKGTFTHRRDMYRAMADQIVGLVVEGYRVCAVYYGHPAVFVDSALVALRRARELGYPTHMFPGISAEDCLFADLLVDPGKVGCQSFEATDFLIRRRKFDPYSNLILWQISMIGRQTFFDGSIQRTGLRILQDELLKTYPPDHRVTLYEASLYPTQAHIAEEIDLSTLAGSDFGAVATLYVPPLGPAPLDPHMMNLLNMSSPQTSGVNQSDLSQEAE